jgi:hypothetical protein
VQVHAATCDLADPAALAALAGDPHLELHRVSAHRLVLATIHGNTLAGDPARAR